MNGDEQFKMASHWIARKIPVEFIFKKKKQTIDIKVALNQCNFHTFHRLNVQKYHEWNAQKLHPIPKIWI